MKALITIFLIFGAFSAAFGQEPDEGDIQFWNETKVYFASIDRTDKNGEKKKFISPHFMGTIRIGQDLRHFVNERVGFGVDIALNDYFKFTPSYYYVAEQKIKNAKEIEHRLRFDLTASKKWSKVGLSNRNRIEYRRRNSKSDSARFRNKTKLDIPIRNEEGKERFTPFIANEPFYDFSKKEWARNEFSAGIGKKLNDSVSAEFFYLLQLNTGNVHKRVNAFGVNFKIVLD